MKKSDRRLGLHRETLAYMTRVSLGQAAGGIFTLDPGQTGGSCPQSCTCTFTCPC